ncbi:MAG TPA: hypothetical protein VNJ08_12885 [Bacteriovoracaceae bacterium]|nr:hypothetical protein [Bacteriovoracaceae bacterium]
MQMFKVISLILLYFFGRIALQADKPEQTPEQSRTIASLNINQNL